MQPDHSKFFSLHLCWSNINAEITDEVPTYASVGVATGKYTYIITTNSSCDTVMLQNMNPNNYACMLW